MNYIKNLLNLILYLYEYSLQMIQKKLNNYIKVSLN